VVSAGLARQLWPGGEPIGARIKAGPTKPWATVVGIVGDVRSGSADAPGPSVYSSHRQDPWPGGGAVVLRTSGDPATLAPAIRDVMRRVDPAMPVVGLRTLEEFRRSTPAIAERRLQMQLLVTFAGVALLVSAIGVYGVSAYATEARRREFGIRMALGSSPRRVLWLALGDSARIAMVGAIAGLPVAWWLAVKVRDLLFAVSPFDVPTIALALSVFALAVFAAAFFPARRATLINPALTMRTD
jgi:predicted lysophospholipase L1 biosynthesis ABC-type transport system permease subunit